MANNDYSTGEIYKSGKRYGGFYTGPASDIDFVNEETIFKGDNVQSALSQISDIFEPDENSEGMILNISVGLNPTTSNLALIIRWDSKDDNDSRINYIDFTMKL